MAERSRIVGVTAALEQATQGAWHERFGMVPESYLTAVEEAGGVPVLLPPQPVTPETIDRLLDLVDALVLTGGADVDPARYGAARHPQTQRAREERDAFETALLDGAIARDLPVLAICRGVQLLNVARGGTLTQHVPDAIGSTVHSPQPGQYGRTGVDVLAGTVVARLLGGAAPRLSVHCHHHQALDRLAPGLRLAATGEGGVVEAVELPDARFVVGVQWHPEENPADRRLFRALLDAAEAGA